MPVRRAGRFVVTQPEELNRWLGRESGLKQPAHVAQTGEPDLIADLKRGSKPFGKTAHAPGEKAKDARVDFGDEPPPALLSQTHGATAMVTHERSREPLRNSVNKPTRQNDP
jgi:hypothetical protein